MYIFTFSVSFVRLSKVICSYTLYELSLERDWGEMISLKQSHFCLFRVQGEVIFPFYHFIFNSKNSTFESPVILITLDTLFYMK